MKNKTNKSEPKTHDFIDCSWGHSCSFTPIDKGLKGSIIGHGGGISKGDYLLLKNGEHSTRYQVTEISYYSDPTDMFRGKVDFAPRKNLK